MVKKILLTFAIVGLLLAGGLALLSPDRVAPAYTIDREIMLEATPEQAWDVLIDFEQYPQWNPYLIRIDGKPEAGEKLSVTLVDKTFDKPMTVEPRMREVHANKSFHWAGTLGVPGLFDTRHYFVLEPVEGEGTRLRQYEDFSGALAWFASKAGNSTVHTEAAFDAMHVALQQRLAHKLTSGRQQ